MVTLQASDIIPATLLNRGLQVILPTFETRISTVLQRATVGHERESIHRQVLAADAAFFALHGARVSLLGRFDILLEIRAFGSALDALGGLHRWRWDFGFALDALGGLHRWMWDSGWDLMCRCGITAPTRASLRGSCAVQGRPRWCRCERRQQAEIASVKDRTRQKGQWSAVSDSIVSEVMLEVRCRVFTASFETLTCRKL